MSHYSTVEIIKTKSGTVNPAYLYLAGLTSDASKKTQHDALITITRMAGELFNLPMDPFSFPWNKLRFEHVTALRLELIKRYAPKTTRRYLAALIGTLKAARKAKMINGDDLFDLIDGLIKGISTDPRKNGRMHTEQEKEALLATCNIGPRNHGIRDAAMICLFMECNLRREEVTTLRLSDFEPDYKPGVDRITIHGKGAKDALGFVTGPARVALRAWLELRGQEPGPLFYTIIKGDEIRVGRSISGPSVYLMLKQRAATAGIPDFMPHNLRRTSISNALDAAGDIGADAMTAMKFARHTNPQTTALYDHRKDDKVIEIATRINIPYMPREECNQPGWLPGTIDSKKQPEIEMKAEGDATNTPTREGITTIHFHKRLFSLSGTAEEHLDRICLELHISRSSAIRESLALLCQKLAERRQMTDGTIQWGEDKRHANENRVFGSYTTEEWEDLKNLYGNRCMSCGRTDVKLTKDHIIPLSKHGQDSIDNIQPLCQPCNSKKHMKTIDYREKA